jgi:hypothetical protein
MIKGEKFSLVIPLILVVIFILLTTVANGDEGWVQKRYWKLPSPFTLDAYKIECTGPNFSTSIGSCFEMADFLCRGHYSVTDRNALMINETTTKRVLRVQCLLGNELPKW